MFVCLGNICRSTLAEFLMRDLVEKKGEGEDFLIASSGTSDEEEGNPVHRGVREILDRMGISYKGKYATTLKKSDYEKDDYFFGMDESNVRSMHRIFGGDKDNKIRLFLSVAGENRGVADPYYSGNFSQTERDVKKGVQAIYEFLVK